jgi:valyl-tRNA synthetase
MNLQGTPYARLDPADLLPEDRWILAKLSQTIRRYHTYMRGYQFSASIKELREFFWDCLCDWYIELTKPRMGGEPRASARADTPDLSIEPRPEGRASTHTKDATAKQVLAFCLDQVLRLFHPTIPFITERLWQQLNATVPKRGLPGIAECGDSARASGRGSSMLVTAAFPPVEGYPALDDEEILVTFGELQDATRGVRELRTQCKVPPKGRVTVTVVVPEAHLQAFRNHSHILRHLAKVGELNVISQGKRPTNAGSVTVRGLRIFVHDVSDDAAERARTEKALGGVEKQIAGKEAKLANQKFIANARPEVVEAERKRLADMISQRTALQEHLAELTG